MSDEAEPTPKVERDDSTPDEPTNDELGTDASADSPVKSPDSATPPAEAPGSASSAEGATESVDTEQAPATEILEYPTPMIPPRRWPRNRSKAPRNPPNLSGGRA
ncbi:hypothetical protein ACRYGV_00970 [Mycobacteroides abscessus]